jgi:hypothetical protein
MDRQRTGCVSKRRGLGCDREERKGVSIPVEMTMPEVGFKVQPGWPRGGESLPASYSADS